MRVGVQLPEVEREARWTEVSAMARASEDVGFDSIWLGDHHLYRDDKRGERGPWEAWTQLAAIAAVTSRVSLGPLVAATAFHAPGMIARMAASIAEVSGGRFVLGLGAGWNQVEFAGFGFPFDHTVTRFEEAFEIIRRLLAGEHVSYRGRYHEARDAVVLPRPAHHIPLMIGSQGPRMLSITLPHVDAWNAWYSWFDNDVGAFSRLNREIDAACEKSGREPRQVQRSVCVFVAMPDGTDERTHDAPPVSIAHLRQHIEALGQAGADEAILVVDPITEASIRALGQELRLTDGVMPAQASRPD